MKKLSSVIKKNSKRIISFIVLCSFVFSLGCSKKRSISLPIAPQDNIDQQNEIISAQITQSFKSMYDDPAFKTAMAHPDFPKAKIYAESYQSAMYDFMAGTISLYDINEQLKNGLIPTKEKLDTMMQEALGLKESSVTKMESDFTQYSKVLKDTGVAQVIDNHYAEIMENSGSENHPMVKGSVDYFSTGLGVDKETVVNTHNNPEVQADLKKGYTYSLNDMENSLSAKKQEEIANKNLLLSKTAEYFAAKNITDLEVIPEDTQKKWFGSKWLKKFLEWLRYLFRLAMTIQAKIILKSIDLFCVIHYNEYFAPNVNIIQTGYTPGYGFFVGGGRVSNGNIGAIPVEYPIIIQGKWIKGFLIYYEEKFFLELDGEKTMITHQDSIPGWLKSSVKSRGNRVMVEATIDMTINSDKIYNLSGIGYTLSIKNITKVYRDPNGIKVIDYDPIGDEVAYNTVRAMFKFQEDLDSTTVNSSNFFMQNEDGSSFPVTVVYEQDPFALSENAVFLNFQTPIEKGKSYTITMTDGIKGISGKYVQSSLIWTFTVGAYSNLYDAEDGLFDNSRFSY